MTDTLVSEASLNSPTHEQNRSSPTSFSFDNVEYLQTRCSICFDAKYDFYFSMCRDQFCKTCFNRYVSELTKSCWGIASISVRCPVCSETLRKDEWSKYVDRSIVEHYEYHTRAFKPLTRACPTCNHSVLATTRFEGSPWEREQRFEEIESLLRRQLGDDHSFPETFRSMYRHFLYGEGLSQQDRSMRSIYSAVMNATETPTPPSPCKRIRCEREATELSSPTLFTLSSMLISMEEHPDVWKDLQFLHVQRYRHVECNHCQTRFCFRCGEPCWHDGMDCLGWMEHLVEQSKQAMKQDDVFTLSASGQRIRVTSDAIANMEWKLLNGKHCPQCATIIHREEGCNKVDCTLCGYRFCWVCSRSWSENCGFYRCKMETLSELKASPDSTDSRLTVDTQQDRSSAEIHSPPELGVPDVISLASRHGSPLSNRAMAFPV